MFDKVTPIIFDTGIENHHVLICGDMNAHTQERDNAVVIYGDNLNLH